MRKLNPNILAVVCLGGVGLLAGLSVVNPPPIYRLFTLLYRGPRDVALTGFDFIDVAVLVVNYLLIAAFGWALGRSYFLTPPRLNLIRLFASFFIGYLCCIGLIRVLSLFLPYEFIYGPTVLIMILIIVAIYYREIGDIGQLLAASRVVWHHFALHLAVLLFLIGLALIHQIRQADYSWVGHGPNQYAYLLNEWSGQTFKHFPIITKHYDEIIMHYFLGQPIHHEEFNPILPWWVTLGVMKASLAAFIFLTYWRLQVPMVWAGLFTAFLFLGTSSFVPTKYYMLFDSSNPLFFTVHSGRLIGIGIILLFVLVKVFQERKLSLDVGALSMLGAIGVSSTSISNIFWVIILLGWMMVMARPVNISAADQDEGRERQLLWNSTLVCYFSVLASILLYALPSEAVFYPWRIAAVIAVAGLMLYRIIAKILAQKGLPKRWAAWPDMVFLGSLLVAVIFLGNMASHNALSKPVMQAVGNVFGEIRFADIPSGKGEPMEQVSTAKFACVDCREMGGYNDYCKGFLEFLAYYGIILSGILLTNYLYIQSQVRNIFSRTSEAIHELFIIAVAGMPCFFFFTDYMAFGSRAWLKTRFLDVPVYFVLFSFFYFAAKVCTYKQKIVLAVFILIYTAGPFLATQRPQQIMHNWEIYLELYKS